MFAVVFQRIASTANPEDVTVTQRTEVRDGRYSASERQPLLCEPQMVSHRYKVGHAEYNVPMATRAREEKRRDFERTKITLAFPLTDTGRPNTQRTNNVYAFLPIRSFGFRFVIQADFLLVANREDLMKENPWNLWLRDQIPDAFMTVFQYFARGSWPSSKPSGLPAAALSLRYPCGLRGSLVV